MACFRCVRSNHTPDQCDMSILLEKGTQRESLFEPESSTEKLIQETEIQIGENC